MKHIKLTLATTLTALAFLCACDDSSSAKDEASGNDATPTQTQTPSDTFTKKEKYTYVFYADANECDWTTDITDVQYDFGPGSSVTVSTTDAEGTKTVTGVYRKTTDDDGDQYYLIQIKDSELTYNYYPKEVLYIADENFVFLASSKKEDVVNAKTAGCAQ